jgi:hypothetical protein
MIYKTADRRVLSPVLLCPNKNRVVRQFDTGLHSQQLSHKPLTVAILLQDLYQYYSSEPQATHSGHIVTGFISTLFIWATSHSQWPYCYRIYINIIHNRGAIFRRAILYSIDITFLCSFSFQQFKISSFYKENESSDTFLIPKYSKLEFKPQNQFNNRKTITSMAKSSFHISFICTEIQFDIIYPPSFVEMIISLTTINNNNRRTYFTNSCSGKYNSKLLILAMTPFIVLLTTMWLFFRFLQLHTLRNWKSLCKRAGSISLTKSGWYHFLVNVIHFIYKQTKFRHA